MLHDRGRIGNVGPVAGALGALTVLLVLGCAEERPPIPAIPKESQSQGKPPISIFDPSQQQQQPPTGPAQNQPAAQNMEAAGVWTVTCEPKNDDCQSFTVTLAPGGGIMSVEGLGAAKGYGQIRNGRLYIAVKGIGEFEGDLDSSGNRAEGTLGHPAPMGGVTNSKHAVAVRGNPLCDGPQAARMRNCR